MVARPFLFPHLLLEGDDLATVLTAAGLPPAVPGEVIYRKMDDGSFRIEVVPTTGEPATVLGLSRRDLDMIFGLTEIDGELAYNGARIAGLTPEQETNLQTLNDTLASYEDRIAALENLAPPETLVITPLPIPPLTDVGPIMSGETFDDILTRLPQFPATLSDGTIINASRTIDSTGSDPTETGDLIRSVRPIWTYPNAQTVIGDPVNIGVTVEQAPINTFITPGDQPEFVDLGPIYEGDTVAQIVARLPEFPATAEDGTILAAIYSADFDGGDPVAAGDQFVSVTPTWTTAEGFSFSGDPIPIGIVVAAIPRIIVTKDVSNDGIGALTTATTAQVAFDAWTGRPEARMSDDSGLSTTYEMRVGTKVIENLSTLLPAGDLVIATMFDGSGPTGPLSITLLTQPVTVTVAGGQAAITGTASDLPDPVLAGTPYFTQLGRIIPGDYPAVNGNAVTISDTRLRSAGIRVPHENRFNLVVIGEVLTPVETVSATGAQTIDVPGLDRTAIAATITETAAASAGALTIGMTEAAVKDAVNKGAANCNNGRPVVGEAIVKRNGQSFAGASLAGGDTVQISVKRTATGATDVVIDLGTVTVAGAQTGTNATSMTHDGVTATFSKSAPTGTYADGSPWVSSGGAPLSITGISPASTVATRTLSGGTTTTGTVNGAMVDPGKSPSGTTLAARQLVNEGEFKGAFNNQQGYDSYVASANQAYNASANVDPGKTGVPLPLTEGTIVKAISIMSGGPSNGRPTVKKLVPMTVVKSPPAVGAFRPGHSDPSKVSWLTTAAVDVSKLPNIAKGTLPVPAFAATYAAVKRFTSWQHTYNVLARNISPRADGAPVYGGDNYIYTEAILALCYDAWTTAEKTQMATAFVQMAIDIVARAEQGAVWQDNGGHCAGQKSVVALAAHLTGHQRFKDALGYTTGVYVWNGGTSSIWGEERQLFRVTQADKNRPKPYPYTSAELGLAEWSSDATRKDPADRENYLNSLTLDIPGDDQSAVESFKPHYRHIIARVNVPGALALRLMGAAGFMQSTFLDYQDRHMAAHFEAPGGFLPDANNNKLRPFTIAAWQRDRATAGTDTGGGGVVLPPEPETPPATGTTFFATESNTRAITGHSQSNEYYGFNHRPTYNKSTVPRPAILHTPNIRYIAIEDITTGSDPDNRKIYDKLVTDANVKNLAVNVSLAALSIWFNRIAPGKMLILAFISKAGTSRREDMDDRELGRYWSDREFVNNYLKTTYRETDALVEYWSANDYKTFKRFDEEWSPYYRKVRFNGQPFTLGTVNPDSTTNPSAIVHHAIWDDSVAGKGEGIYPKTTRWTHFPAEQGPDEIAGYNRMRGLPGIKDRLLPMGSTMDAHSYSGGHAVVDDADGQVYYGWSYSKTFAEVVLNKPFPNPKLKRYEEGPNGSYIDIVVDLPNNGTLSTIAKSQSRMPWSPALAHQQEVICAQIRRVGQSEIQRQYVMLPSASGYAASTKGTVVIQNAGTGTAPNREARIRVTPTVPFEIGDMVYFRWIDHNTSPVSPGNNPQDGVDKPWVHNPVEIVPGWTDLSAMYPHPGLPFETYPAPYTVGTGASSSGGGTTTPPTTGDVFYKQGATGPYYVDPVNSIPSGTTRITYRFRVRLPVGVSIPGNSQTIASQEAGSFELGIDTFQAPDGRIRVVVENSAGTSVNPSNRTLHLFTKGQWVEGEVYLDTGTDAVFAKINGGSFQQYPLSGPLNGFQFSRGLTIGAIHTGAFQLTPGMEVDYIEALYTTNGVQTLRKRVNGPASTANAAAWKAGGDAS